MGCGGSKEPDDAVSNDDPFSKSQRALGKKNSLVGPVSEKVDPKPVDEYAEKNRIFVLETFGAIGETFRLKAGESLVDQGVLPDHIWCIKTGTVTLVLRGEERV